MTKLQVRAFLYQFGVFLSLFITAKLCITAFVPSITGVAVPLLSFGFSTLLGPKFYATKTKDGEKLFMKWIFFKEIKEIV